MTKIKGNKRNRRLCKWMTSLLTTILLVNQIGFLVLAEETTGAVCCCDIRCSADSVNEGCPVCAQDYGRCEVAEDATDTGTDGEPEDSSVGVDTDEEPENPGAGEGVDTDTETVLGTGAGEETEDAGTGSDVTMIGEAEEPDEGEDDTDVEEEATSRAAAEGTIFTDGGLKYRIIDDAEDNRQVKVASYVDGESVSGDFVIPPTALYKTNQYKVVGIE